MNKKRELMASVVTSVQPTGSLTMTEYNPYDLALGLFGREGVLDQAGQTITNQSYTVPSVPGIITVVDSDGNRCMDISNVTIAPATATPASISFATDSTPSTGTVSGNTYTDTNGGTITINLGDFIPLSETDIYLRYILSTMTGMKKISFYKIANISNIDFVKYMPRFSIYFGNISNN